MKLRNPTGRAITLEVLVSDKPAMYLRIGAHATVDIAKYDRALGALSDTDE